MKKQYSMRLYSGRRAGRSRTVMDLLPESMLEQLKLLAHKRDVPYQSLVKMFLAERLESELRHRHG